MSKHRALLELVDGYLAGELDGARQAELERALCSDPDAARTFWIAINHEILLRQHHFGAQETAHAAPFTLRKPWRKPRLLLAIAALVLVAIGVPALIAFTRPGKEIATITSVDTPRSGAGRLISADARQVDLHDGLIVHDGDRVEVATGASIAMRLHGEQTRLDFGSGSIASLTAGPAGLRIGMDSGSLSATVEHQGAARRLAVVTPEAQIVDQGTRFSVTVRPASTSIEVSEGHVQVTARNGAAPALDLGPGGHATAEPHGTLAETTVPYLQWSDRRPLGVMMLCRNTSGWATNPRGWLNDETLDSTTPSGRAILQARLERAVEEAIANLTAIDAQGLVFWDLEGLESAIGYVGEPRRLDALAPEMDAVVDRLMARVRGAGLQVGVAIRTEAVVRTAATAGLELKPVDDPVLLVLSRIAYAQKRWGASLFPVLGPGTPTMDVETLCRRVHAAVPDVLLIPTGAGGDLGRWSAPWLHFEKEPPANRLPAHGEFRIIAPLEEDYLVQHHDLLVEAVAAGDILTVRAWYKTASHQLVHDIHAAARRPHP